MKNIFTFCFLISTACFSQEKSDFSINYGVDVMSYANKLAEQYVAEDTTYYFYDLKQGNGMFNDLNTGLEHNLSISYQPLYFMDFGIIGSYQFAKFERTFALLDFHHPDENGEFPVINGTILNAVNAKSVGVTTNIHFNRLFHFENASSKFLNKLQVSVGLNGLYGRSEFSEKSGIETYAQDLKNFRYRADNLNFRTELAIGYQLFRKTYFSNLGFKVGYQYFKTSTLKSFSDGNLVPQESPNNEVSLDFSGIYYGVYLKIGK